MQKTKIILLGLFIFCLTSISVFGQTSNIVKKNLSQAEIDRVVRTFTANEKTFREALTNYVFNRSASIHTIGMGGQISGTYRRDSFLNLLPDGKRVEKILYAPIPTITEITVTPADIDNLSGVDQFAIDPAVASQYNFTFLGMEKVDELNLYVFDVAPKMALDPKKIKQHFFTGRVWVDERDLMIVKSKGKAIPEQKNEKFPIIETWRENVDGKYWFPSYASADDELVFDNGNAVKIKVRIKYNNYAQGKSEVRILDDVEDVKDDKPQPKPSPTPKKP